MRVFENKTLSKIFGTKREEVIWDWTRLHNEELCDLYFYPNIRLIKTSGRWWVGHVARAGRGKVCLGFR